MAQNRRGAEKRECTLAIYLVVPPCNAFKESLESEADCNVSQAVFIRDPALLKQSGAAWVLFDDEQSVKQAIEWYARGEAHIFGTAFCISAIPATVASYDESVTAESEKEKETLEIERKRKENSDRIMMEESQQLAEERAAYREAHAQLIKTAVFGNI